MSKKFICLFLFFSVFALGCAHRYSCSDPNVINSVKKTLEELLSKTGVATKSITLDLITLDSKNEQTGKIQCNARITIDVDRFMSYGKLQPPAHQIPQSGMIEFSVSQDQSNDKNIVVTTKIIQLEGSLN